MHIFLVNDDGIGAPGIMALLHAAVSAGHEVTMCAPKYQQSAASHRFTIADPIYAAPWPTEIPNCRAWAITGSPADCVRIGVDELLEKPVDVLISGINKGYNAGVAVQYSGTVGAAMEGSFYRIPSIAASIHHKATQEMLDHFAAYVIRIAQQYASAQTPASTILNINAPLTAPKDIQGVVYAPLDTANFADHYVRRESPRAGTYFWLDDTGEMEAFTPGCDNDWLEKGHITLTLMGAPVSHDQSIWDALHIR